MTNAPFRKVLIANRGEIAVRVIRTCQRLGIATVVVHSEADATSLAVEQAGEAVPIGPSRAQDSYLNQSAILAALASSGADALHPGYGLLSEDASFARAVTAAGVRFIGPSAEALQSLGDKITARGLAAAAGLKPPPGTSGQVGPNDLAGALTAATQLGYPVLVKAAAGGGGIGMQRAGNAKELEQALATCGARSRAAFGDDRLYLERWIERPRHIEIQVARDGFGNSIALGDRECSVQRRHQKLLEECPSPAAFLTPERREALYQGAQGLLDQVDYVGVATVEFVAESKGEAAELYFLEVNARIQVEHPVTEMVRGIDLVELQLELAAGRPLPSWAVNSHETGHAIEVRLYAEDPAKQFMPQPGTLQTLQWPAIASIQPGSVRIDTGYRAGDTVTPYYDPLIAKLICHAATRNQALDSMSRALDATRLELLGPKGPRISNLEFLRGLLQSARLKSGDYDTHLIEDILIEDLSVENARIKSTKD